MVRVFEQGLEGSEAEDLVDDLLGELVALEAGEGNALLGEELLDHAEELLLSGLGLVEVGEAVKVQALDELLVDGGLDLLLNDLRDAAGGGPGGVGIEAVREGFDGGHKRTQSWVLGKERFFELLKTFRRDPRRLKPLFNR